MPKETFWDARSVEGDGSMPVLTIAWGDDRVLLNGIPFDKSGLSRAIKTLRTARKHAFPPSVAWVAVTSPVYTRVDGQEIAFGNVEAQVPMTIN